MMLILSIYCENQLNFKNKRKKGLNSREGGMD